MPQSLKTLIGSTIEAGDRRVTLREAFFHMDDGKLRYVALDIGGWLNVDEVLVEAGHLRRPETPEAGWSVALDEETLRQAPGWDQGNRQDAVDMTNWPPVIVGPFGNAFSPMLVHEQMRDLEAPDRDTGAQAPSAAEGLVMRLQKAGSWIGLPVFSGQGEEGEILDILFDPDSLRITGLEVGEKTLLSQSGRVLPYDAIRHMADQGTHLIVDLDSTKGDTAGL